MSARRRKRGPRLTLSCRGGQFLDHSWRDLAERDEAMAALELLDGLLRRGARNAVGLYLVAKLDKRGLRGQGQPPGVIVLGCSLISADEIPDRVIAMRGGGFNQSAKTDRTSRRLRGDRRR